MCGDAKTSGEGNLDGRCVWPAKDAVGGVVFVPNRNEMNLRVGISGKLCAVVRNVVRLAVVWDVVASCCNEGVCERVE